LSLWFGCIASSIAVEKTIDQYSIHMVCLLGHFSATHLLIALLLPLGDQHRIGVVVLEQPVVQRLADGFFLVVQVVDVA
jgi:hypothetical protein